MDFSILSIQISSAEVRKKTTGTRSVRLTKTTRMTKENGLKFFEEADVIESNENEEESRKWSDFAALAKFNDKNKNP